MKSVVFVLLLLMSHVMTAAESSRLAPLLDHIAAPRLARDLGGTWEWTSVADLESLPAADATWRSTTVPGTHEDLFRKPLDVRATGRVWFRTHFALGVTEAARQIDLHAERIADRCLIVLNGTRISEHAEGWNPFSVALSSATKAGTNELLLGVTASEAGGALGRRPVGIIWFYGQFLGIPFPVHLEFHDRLWIAGVAVDPRLDGGSRLISRVTLRNEGDQAAVVRVSGTVAEAFVHTPRTVEIAAGGTAEVELSDAWPAPRLWWPHDPQLQRLDLRLEHDGVVVDVLQQRFGFREIRVVGPDMLLNGVPLLQRRESIISYRQYADGSELDPLLMRMRANGINGVRLHLGPALRIARRCDELGFLVSPEAAICQPSGNRVEEEFWPAAAAHLDGMVASMQNCPSVIYWCISNEFGSYYMPADDAIAPGKHGRAWVDAWQADQVRRLALRDPTRIAVASGDGEIGGWGVHGPGPALSVHYAWQPWKLGNQLPQTADWLVKGLTPWQGIVWDRTKPMMLSEDLFEDYCLHVPHGLSQWAGDAAYDPPAAIQAVRQAYRWFAAGHYRAHVSVWNPWAVDSSGPSEKFPLSGALQADGGLMPEYLAAWRGHERTFVGGVISDRTIDVHHRGFRPLGPTTLVIELRDGETVFWSRTIAVDLPPGSSREVRLDLPLPAVSTVHVVTAHIELRDGTQVLSRQDERWVLCPSAVATLPAGTCWLGESAPAGVVTAANLSEALARAPTVLVIARQHLSQAEVAGPLQSAVEHGLHVVWLETGSDMRLPSPLHAEARHDTANAFIRSPLHPLCADLAPELLMSWRPAGRVCAEAVPKSALSGWQVLLDVGGPDGLSHAAVMRRRYGAGTMTVCQLAIPSALAAGEPAAAVLLSRIVSLPNEPEPAHQPLLLVAPPASAMPDLLRRMGIVATAWTAGATGVLLVDGSSSDDDTRSIITGHLAHGGTVVLHEPGAGLIQALGTIIGHELRVQPANVRHLRREGAHVLTEGLSNDDLWWEPSQGYSWLAPEKTAGKPPIITAIITGSGIELPLTPAGLAVVPVGQGRLVIDLVRWSERMADQPVRARRYLRTVLTNLGADLGTLSPTEWAPLTLGSAANTSLAGSEAGVAHQQIGWPGPGSNDLRYFPVNRTGMDPRLKVPAPREPLPSMLQLAGVPFMPIDRELQAFDAVVLAKEATVTIAAKGSARRVWLAGGAAGWLGDGQTQLAVVWCYANGTTDESLAVAGDHLGTVLERTPMRRGLVGWTGPTPTHEDAVVWVWSHDNPHTDRQLTGITLRGVAGGVAVMGVTLER